MFWAKMTLNVPVVSVLGCSLLYLTSAGCPLLYLASSLINSTQVRQTNQSYSVAVLDTRLVPTNFPAVIDVVFYYLPV